MTKIVNPEYTVERIVERMRQASGEVISSDRPSIAVAEDGHSRNGAEPDIRPLKLQPTFAVQDRYHVRDLLQYNDEPFVENAYQAILRRGSDPVGRDGMLQGLRSGELNKIDVLARLRYSKEGRREGVRIDGLFLPASLRTVYRLPVVGYLFNLLVAMFRLPSVLRSHRQFESHILAHEEIFVRHINHLGETVKSVASGFADSQARLVERVQSENAQLLAEQTKTHEVLLARIEEFTRYVEGRMNDEAADRHSELSSALAQHRELSEAMITSANQHLTERFDSIHRELMSELTELKQRERRFSSELALQSQQLRSMRHAEPVTSVTADRTFAEENPRLLDGFFAAFDEKFRGDREEIKKRLRVYLPFIPTGENVTLIDLGCGRGEWLELLKESDVNAAGVDSNSVLVQLCRDYGLQVVEQDLFSYLGTIPAGSVSAISAFHVAEHLSIDKLISLLSESLRVLRPGGVLLLETPNPRNVLVGTCNFYFDPTHRNPLPSEVLKLLVEDTGFTETSVLPLNPSDATPVEGDSEIVKRFNEYFYGPMDYGIVAHRP